MTTSADAALAEALRLLTWPDRIALARDVDMGGADLARIVGVSRATVSSHAKRHGGLPDKRAERMRRLNADPEFAAAHAERMRRRHADPEFAAANAERMRRLNADPEFAAANAERMRRRHADPEFAAANAERMRRLHADPEFAAAHAERSAERMRRRHADGRVHPHIALMTPEQRADYDTLRRNGYRKAEALAALGLVARRDALPPGSHKRAALDERIRAMTHDMLEGRA